MTHPGPSIRRAHTWGAACWLLTLPYFAVEPIVASAWDTPYSFTRDTISVLGISDCVTVPAMPSVTVCSPLHLMMNSAFVVLGLLTLAGVILLRSIWPPHRLSTVGLTVLVAAALSTVATGLVPVNVNVTAHAVAALPQFLLQNVGMLLLALAVGRADHTLAVSSTLCGLVGLTGLVLFVGAVPWELPQGALERLALYPLTVWTTVIAIAVLWRERSTIRGQHRETGRLRLSR